MERREPTISTLKPDAEDAQRHQSKGATPRAGGGKPAPAASRPQPAYAQRPVKVRTSPLVPVAFLLAITGLGLAGFSYWQLMQAQSGLVSAEQRIAELEKKLELTDDESSASLTAVQAKLKWADSEIRKLWGVSYDKNRKAIAENTETLKSVKKQAASLDGKVKDAVKKATAGVEGMQSKLESVSNRSLQQQTQMQMLTDRLTQLEDVESSLEKRIAENEQAIKAIDSFRRSVNRQILELQSPGGTP